MALVQLHLNDYQLTETISDTLSSTFASPRTDVQHQWKLEVHHRLQPLLEHADGGIIKGSDRWLWDLYHAGPTSINNRTIQMAGLGSTSRVIRWKTTRNTDVAYKVMRVSIPDLFEPTPGACTVEDIHTELCALRALSPPGGALRGQVKFHGLYLGFGVPPPNLSPNEDWAAPALQVHDNVNGEDVETRFWAVIKMDWAGETFRFLMFPQLTAVGGGDRDFAMIHESAAGLLGLLGGLAIAEHNVEYQVSFGLANVETRPFLIWHTAPRPPFRQLCNEVQTQATGSFLSIDWRRLRADRQDRQDHRSRASTYPYTRGCDQLPCVWWHSVAGLARRTVR